MAALGLDVKTMTVQLANTATDFQGDTVGMAFYRAPTDTFGGGITILEAWAVNGATTTAGTTFSIAILNYGTAGTAVKASGGTIGAAIGGTADVWTAGVPKSFTVTNAFVDAGEYLVVYKDETNSSDPTRMTVGINYVMGK